MWAHWWNFHLNIYCKLSLNNAHRWHRCEYFNFEFNGKASRLKPRSKMLSCRAEHLREIPEIRVYTQYGLDQPHDDRGMWSLELTSYWIWYSGWNSEVGGEDRFNKLNSLKQGLWQYWGCPLMWVTHFSTKVPWVRCTNRAKVPLERQWHARLNVRTMDTSSQDHSVGFGVTTFLQGDMIMDHGVWCFRGKSNFIIGMVCDLPLVNGKLGQCM
jgi:hypothetical protein